MKKYKFIKRYPNYPTSMVTGNIVEWNDAMNVYHHAPTLDTFKRSEIEGFPEFWEELKPEKEYDILSFQNPSSKYIFTKRMDGNFSRSSESVGHNERYMLENTPCKIYSIQRLSDGEIFTVGDRTRTSASASISIIYSFEIENEELIINCTHSFLAKQKNINLLEDIKLIRKPLFTTEDGVEVFEGDMVHFVSLVEKVYTTHETKARKELTPVPKYFKYFFTLENAQSFIIFNKPMFSINDVKQLLKGKFIFPIQSIFIAAAKQKLKL